MESSNSHLLSHSSYFVLLFSMNNSKNKNLINNYLNVSFNLNDERLSLLGIIWVKIYLRIFSII